MILAISIILIIVAIVFFYLGNQRLSSANMIQVTKERELEEKERLQKENDDLQKKNSELLLNQTEILLSIEKEKKKIDELYNNEKNKISEQINIFKNNTSYATEQYVYNLEKQMAAKENEYKSKIAEINKQKINAETQLKSVKNALNAATEAQLREREKEEKIDFYKLSITKDEMNDIQLLDSIKPRLKQPRALCMLIWSSYYQKQTTDLCNRVLKLKNPMGVYKITNIKTGQVYVGQATKIADRWKEHVKCGLGIDTPVTNKLYKAMAEYGVYNFTFELLEECSRDRLNEVERFWIEMYQSDKAGYNSTKGNK